VKRQASCVKQLRKGFDEGTHVKVSRTVVKDVSWSRTVFLHRTDFSTRAGDTCQPNLAVPGFASSLPSTKPLVFRQIWTAWLAFQLLTSAQETATMGWTPNRVTALRVLVGFAAVALFGHGSRANLAAVVLTVASIALDALDGHIARKKRLATPLGAQIDILGDRLIENMFFTYFAVVGMVSLWLPVFFFARGAATDFLRGLALKAGYSGWGSNAMLQTWWGQALVASRWSRGLYAALKCACFCYLGLELALTRGPVALLGALPGDAQLTIRGIAQALTWATAAFCLLRALPVCMEGWRFFAQESVAGRARKSAEAA
jgi:phosphatidylglycerophosphate synthase